MGEMYLVKNMKSSVWDMLKIQVKMSTQQLDMEICNSGEGAS